MIDFMHDRSDGCLLILSSVGGASLLTLLLFSTVLGDHPKPGTHGGPPAGLVVACGVAWVVVIGVILAEAIHDQRRPRR